jgi:hypothetical protein
LVNAFDVPGHENSALRHGEMGEGTGFPEIAAGTYVERESAAIGVRKAPFR